ncbi:MAG: WD40/YVTN/BNR-like repeat-containing protein [Xenococcaceae cyanobacterium]
MNKWQSAIKSLGLFLLSIAFCLYLNFDRTLAHVPHDDVYRVVLSANYSQDQTLYMLVRGNLFKSTNGGDNWQRLVKGIDNHGNLVTFTLASQNNQILYLSSLTDGIYKSVDEGKSWFTVNQGLENLLLDNLVTSVDGETVLAAGYEQGLYYTNNGGADWQTIIQDQKITAVAIHPQQANYLVVGDRQGKLYLSIDGGKTWQIEQTIGKGSAITAIAFSPDFISERSKPGSKADGTIYLGTEAEGVWQSKDEGKTFVALNGNNSPVNIRDIVPLANQATTNLFVSDWNQGVFFSSDDGKSWTKYNQGLTKDVQADQKNFQRPHFNDLEISADFERDQTLFVTGFDGLFKSTNKGQTWQEVDAFRRSIIGLVVSPNYKNDSTVAVLNYVGEAYLSRDGGEAWQPMYQGLELPSFTRKFTPPNIEPRRFFQMAISPNYSEDKTIFATVLWTKFLTYTDKSQRWRISTPPQEARSMAIAVSPNFAQDQTIYLAAQKGVIFKSTNGGKNFTVVGKIDRAKGNESPSLVISPNFAQDGTLYVTGGKGIYKTVDEGKTWKLTTSNTSLQDRFNLKLAISPNYQSDRTVMVSTDRGLFITKNNGDSWQQVINSAFDQDAMLTGIAISPNYSEDKTYLINVRGKGLWKTTDNGATFQSIGDDSINLALLNNFESSSIPIQFSPNYQQDNTIYGIGSAGSQIYKSTDGGETWSTLTIPQAEIFQQYINEQYDLKTSMGLFWYVYQSRILKIIAALVAAAISYLLLGFVSLEQKLPVSKIKLQIVGSLSVLIMSAVFLFI